MSKAEKMGKFGQLYVGDCLDLTNTLIDWDKVETGEL